MDKELEGGDFGKIPLELQRYLFSFFRGRELRSVRTSCKYLLNFVDKHSAKFALKRICVKPDPFFSKDIVKYFLNLLIVDTFARFTFYTFKNERRKS